MSSSRRPFLSRLLVVLVLLGPACASRAAGPTGPIAPALSPAQQLAGTLDALFATSPADRVVWGVSVRVPGGEPLYQRNANVLLHPASNMKLVTLAAAAERLGWDFRFPTTIRSTTPVEPDGTLRGDLVVIGGGDPTIGRRHDGQATLAHLAERVWQSGVRRVEGRVIGDGSAFGGTAFGEGWQWDDLPFSYAAPVSALIYNENTAERGLFYQALNVVLEVLLDDDLELHDYAVNFRRMFGNPRMDAVMGSVDGSVRFFGLTPTSIKLEGLDRHRRLIDSYKKLHVKRTSVAALSR